MLKSRPLLSFKQLFYLSVCGFGLQFASSLQMTDTTSLFKFLGAESGNIGYLWLVAPVAGMIIQPVVGQFSDSTMTRYGKRIPYIFVWAILACIGLVLVPFSQSLWVAAAYVWLLTCSINGCTEGLRALIGDITPNQQKSTAFAWQTVFCGVGAGVAAVLPWLLENSHLLPKANESADKVPMTLQVSFWVGGFIFLVCMLIMVRHIKEKAFMKSHLLYDLQMMRHRSRTQKIYGAFKELFRNIKHMPKVIKDFAVVQIFTWTGMFCIWLYFGLALAQHVYGLPVTADIVHNTQYQRLLEQGTVQAGFCFGIYQFVNVFYAMVLPKLTEKIAPRTVHALSLLIGALSLIAIMFTKDLYVIYGFMIGVGIMWGSIMTLPYAIISAELPRSKMGVYLGIFNITITLPQIVAGLFMGTVSEKLFHNHALYSLVLGGVMLLISAIIMLYQVGFNSLTVLCKKKVPLLEARQA